MGSGGKGAWLIGGKGAWCGVGGKPKHGVLGSLGLHSSHSTHFRVGGVNACRVNKQVWVHGSCR